jgi:phage tail tape-measure protein
LESCNSEILSVNARLTFGIHSGCSSIVDSFLGRTSNWEKRKREPTMAKTAKKAAPRRKPAKVKAAAKRAGSARRKPAAKRATRKSPARRKGKAA